jgi:hypothetical protein
MFKKVLLCLVLCFIFVTNAFALSAAEVSEFIGKYCCITISNLFGQPQTFEGKIIKVYQHTVNEKNTTFLTVRMLNGEYIDIHISDIISIDKTQ